MTILILRFHHARSANAVLFPGDCSKRNPEGSFFSKAGTLVMNFGVNQFSEDETAEFQN